jgi:hypothetical protein
MWLATEPTSKWLFDPGLPRLWKLHNFASKPPIEMRFNKVVAFVESFPMVCHTPSANK